MQGGFAGLDRAAAGGTDLSYCFDVAIRKFGCGGRGFTEHSAGGVDRIDRIGLAPLTSVLAVGPRHLDHCYTLPLQMALQAGAVGAGALHTDLVQVAE